MGLREKIRAIERIGRVSKQDFLRRVEPLEMGRLEEIASIVSENARQAISLAEGLLPEKAMKEIMKKDDVGVFGSYSYSSEEEMERKERINQRRYGIEKELLGARHPDSIKKLWKRAKPILEKRYGKKLRSREDLVIMNNMYMDIQDFKREVKQMEYSIFIAKMLERYAKQDNIWRKVREIWIEYNLDYNVRSAANGFIGMIKNAKDPGALVPKPDPDDDEDMDPWGGGVDLNSHCGGHGGGFQMGGPFLRPDAIADITDVLMKSAKNKLPFLDALNILEPRYTQQNNLRNDMNCLGETLKNAYADMLVKPVCNAMKRHYKNKEDEGFRMYMEWFSGLILQRWKSTAPDYEKMFRFHEPDSWDQWHMRVFYEIRNGKHISEYDKNYSKIINVGRLPGILKLMLKDGVIKEEQIDPPLKERYPGPGEILKGGGKALPEGGIETLLKLDFRRPEARILTGLPSRKMLPGPSEMSNLPAIADDISGLSGLMDLSRTYRVVYQGNHSVFVAAEVKMPNGRIDPGSIYRFAVLKEGAECEGATVTIKGHVFNVKKEPEEVLVMSERKAVYDVTKDDLPCKAITYVVDISPEEFAARYIRDFLAHAFVHNKGMGSMDDYQKRLNDALSIEGYKIAAYLDRTNSAVLRTFDFGGRFAFQIEATDMFGGSMAYFFSEALMGYLEDVGLAYHRDDDLDEKGRRFSEAKKQERKFYAENIAAIAGSVRDNLVNILCFAYASDKYRLRDFGESDEPCEKCGERYFKGLVCREKQQSEKGFYAENLHHLAKHPETMVHEFGELRKIKELLCDAEEYTPVFVKHPEIISEIAQFSVLHAEASKAGSEAFWHWQEHCGGTRMYEKEEIRNDPGLRALQKEERRLKAEERRTDELAINAANALLEKYRHFIGDELNEEYFSAVRYWSNQIILLNIYQVCGPKMLAASSKDMPGVERFCIDQGF